MKRVVFFMTFCFWVLFAGCMTNKETVSVLEEVKTEAVAAQPKEPERFQMPAKIRETGYAYTTLSSQDEQELYLQLYHALYEGEMITLNAVTEEQLEQVFFCVMADHPEVFYADGYQIQIYSRGEQISKIEFCPSLTVETEELEVLRRQIQETAAEWMKELTPAMDEYEKFRYLYEKVVLHTEYDIDATNGQNIQSVFLTGRSVCQGYAKALQYLCLQCNLECITVSGTANGTGHAWVLVKLDGDWYHADPTWADAVYRSGQEEWLTAEAIPEICYDYFCVTDEEIGKTHQLSDVISWPVCNAVDNQYYRREGLFIETADLKKIQEILDAAVEQGKENITFQCADDQVYEALVDALIDKQRIFDLIPGNRVSYADSQIYRTLTFWLVD